LTSLGRLISKDCGNWFYEVRCYWRWYWCECDKAWLTWRSTHVYVLSVRDPDKCSFLVSRAQLTALTTSSQRPNSHIGDTFLATRPSCFEFSFYILGSRTSQIAWRLKVKSELSPLASRWNENMLILLSMRVIKVLALSVGFRNHSNKTSLHVNPLPKRSGLIATGDLSW